MPQVGGSEHGDSAETTPGATGLGSRARDGRPRVLVAIRHRAMRELTGELLKRQLAWAIAEVGEGEMLVDAIGARRPDVIVVDTGDFPACCLAALERFPRDRVIVIGREPDDRSRAVALAEGAGSWVVRERIAEELVGELRAMLAQPPGSQGTDVA